MADTHPRRLAPRPGLSATLLAALGVALAAACTPIGAGIGAGATIGVVIAQERSAGDALRDTRINLEISEALFQAHIDDLFREIHVDVMEGRVLLTGLVNTEDLADRANLIAWKVDGVAKVINEIRVGEPGTLDAVRDRWISAKLRARLLGDTKVFDVNYSIVTVAGAIYLLGIAQNPAELERVLAHARDIAYVRRVTLHVVMKDDPERQRG